MPSHARKKQHLRPVARRKFLTALKLQLPSNSSLVLDSTDILCLCVHKISTAIIQCSSMRSPSECHPASLVLVNEVLSEMCTAGGFFYNLFLPFTFPHPNLTNLLPTDSTTTTSSISSSTIQSGQISITTNSVTPESTSTSQTSSTSAVSSTTPDVVSSLSQTTTQPSSSTLVVVTTVVIPPTSTPTSGAGRLDVSISTRALFFGLPSLISLIAAI